GSGELMWSIPVEEGSSPLPGAASIPELTGLGEEGPTGEFDFSGLQPFDLGSLELTPEERAYLIGGEGSDLAVPAAPAGDTGIAVPSEPSTSMAQGTRVLGELPTGAAGGVPELLPWQEEPATAEDAAGVAPFSFTE